MVRTAAKRKSEGDIPDNRKKLKATASTSANYDASSQEQQSSEALFVKESAPVYVKKDRPKARKSAPVRRVDDEFFEDEGRMETQQFIDLVALQTKKKMVKKSTGDFAEKFKASIQDEEQGLKKRVEDLGVVATNEDSTFHTTFKRAFDISCPGQPPEPTLAPPSDLYFSTLYPRTQHLVSSARSIIAQFVATADATAKLESSEELQQQVTNWNNENESVRQLMDVGHRVGVQKVEAMLEGRGEIGVDEGDEDMVGILYGVGDREGEGEMGVGERMVWGKLAKKQLKAGKRLFRTTVAEIGA